MTGATITTLDDIMETFELLDDWQDRYAYIIELGEKVPDMPEALKTEETRVQGCTSNVWLISRPSPEDDSKIEFIADSDAQVVRGLVAILLTVYSQKTADEILAFDVEELFNTIGLNQHLSRSRSNGLRSMVERIRNLASLN